jgi:glycosyltransferase involved in cell wall biosynthesis
MGALQARLAVTPVLLTLNEEPNIGRTLASLSWADKVVVLDSGSTDGTERVARGFPAVRWFTRPFDAHAKQWRFAVEETGVESEYILALDADMSTSASFLEELEFRFLAGSYVGATIPFEYWMMGRRLPGSIYPPQVRLFRRGSARVEQDGHTQRFVVDAPAYRFRSRLRHDDRKSLERWVHSQLGYSKKELERLNGEGRSALKDRLRRTGLMPIVAGSVAYVRTGGPLGGGAALRYTWERVVFECLLAMRLFDGDSPPSPGPRE